MPHLHSCTRRTRRLSPSASRYGFWRRTRERPGVSTLKFDYNAVQLLANRGGSVKVPMNQYCLMGCCVFTGDWKVAPGDVAVITRYAIAKGLTEIRVLIPCLHGDLMKAVTEEVGIYFGTRTEPTILSERDYVFGAKFGECLGVPSRRQVREWNRAFSKYVKNNPISDASTYAPICPDHKKPMTSETGGTNVSGAFQVPVLCCDEPCCEWCWVSDTRKMAKVKGVLLGAELSHSQARSSAGNSQR